MVAMSVLRIGLIRVRRLSADFLQRKQRMARPKKIPKLSSLRFNLMSYTNTQERFAIYRYYAPGSNGNFGKPRKFIQYVYSREEAEKWCSDPKTRKAGKWFEGFTKE